MIITGYGGLSLSIEGPSKADIECHDNEDGTCRVTYKPTEPGTYIINIKFADEHVPGQCLACIRIISMQKLDIFPLAVEEIRPEANEV